MNECFVLYSTTGYVLIASNANIEMQNNHQTPDFLLLTLRDRKSSLFS